MRFHPEIILLIAMFAAQNGTRYFGTAFLPCEKIRSVHNLTFFKINSLVEINELSI